MTDPLRVLVVCIAAVAAGCTTPALARNDAPTCDEMARDAGPELLDGITYKSSPHETICRILALGYGNQTKLQFVINRILDPSYTITVGNKTYSKAADVFFNKINAIRRSPDALTRVQARHFELDGTPLVEWDRSAPADLLVADVEPRMVVAGWRFEGVIFDAHFVFSSPDPEYAVQRIRKDAPAVVYHQDGKNFVDSVYLKRIVLEKHDPDAKLTPVQVMDDRKEATALFRRLFENSKSNISAMRADDSNAAIEVNSGDRIVRASYQERENYWNNLTVELNIRDSTR